MRGRWPPLVTQALREDAFDDDALALNDGRL